MLLCPEGQRVQAQFDQGHAGCLKPRYGRAQFVLRSRLAPQPVGAPLGRSRVISGKRRRPPDVQAEKPSPRTAECNVVPVAPPATAQFLAGAVAFLRAVEEAAIRTSTRPMLVKSDMPEWRRQPRCQKWWQPAGARSARPANAEGWVAS